MGGCNRGGLWGRLQWGMQWQGTGGSGCNGETGGIVMWRDYGVCMQWGDRRIAMGGIAGSGCNGVVQRREIGGSGCNGGTGGDCNGGRDCGVRLEWGVKWQGTGGSGCDGGTGGIVMGVGLWGLDAMGGLDAVGGLGGL